MDSDYVDLAACFKALGHPTRLQILDLLRRGEVCVCHLEAALDQRQAYISQQLMLLREAHLVEARKEGMRVYYRLTCDLVAELLAVALGPLDDPVLIPVQGCPCPTCSGEMRSSEGKKQMLTIKVLGSGCPNCRKVEDNTRAAIAMLQPAGGYEIVKVTDPGGISEYVMRTPGLVINDRLVCEGRVPRSDEIMTWLADALSVEA